MPEKRVETQEGPVTLGAAPGPTSAAPAYEYAYSSKEDERLAKEEADRLSNEAQGIFRGEDWAEGLPNYYCPLCPFATLDGDVAVLSHGAMRHPGVDLKEKVTKNG